MQATPRPRTSLWARTCGAVAVALAALWSPGASARDATFTIAIGYNGVPAAAADEPQVLPLRFADDDAFAVVQLSKALGRRTYLLAVPDAQTSTRFPALVGEARPPSVHELDQVVRQLDGELAVARKAGVETSVILFYSGHGTLAENGQGSLALVDGQLTRQQLYDEVLARLPARYVHVLVDACHAESVVRPRDVRAATTAISATAAGAYVTGITLARFPNVGAVVSSAVANQAHEWEVYQGGVFTHEVLSALRGGADVNGDRRVEYSELAAFLAAANRSVADPRARLDSVVKPPLANPRAAVVDLSSARGFAHLAGRPAALGAFFIEDAGGARLLDMRAEPGYRVDVLLPPTRLYLRTARHEVELDPRPEQVISFDALTPEPTSTRSRGAINSSLHRGLFATRFGPAYYAGFVDRAPDLAAVELPVADVTFELPSPPRRRLSPWFGGGAAVLAGTAAVFGGMALEARSQYNDTTLANPSRVLQDRYDRARFAGLGFAAGALISAGAAWWLWSAGR
jgi:hypothetical protein